MAHIRDIFDNLSLSVIQFLESHNGIKSVQFFEIGGTTLEDIEDEWEEKNKPFVLPDDFKAFLQISDGLLLRWSIKLNNETIPLGNMHLNSLETIKKLKTTGQVLPPRPMTNDSETSHFTAFTLDSSANDGHVCFIYKNKKYTDPEIWFQDLACKWHFMAPNFTAYYRLMIVHMGLPHWQYAFTDIGLDPITKVWFRFLSPERLEMDLKYLKARTEWEKSFQLPNATSTLSKLEEKPSDFAYKPPKLNLKKINQVITKIQANPTSTSAREVKKKRSTTANSASRKYRSSRYK